MAVQIATKPKSQKHRRPGRHSKRAKARDRKTPLMGGKR
jgi:hypothetical protein